MPLDSDRLARQSSKENPDMRSSKRIVSSAVFCFYLGLAVCQPALAEDAGQTTRLATVDVHRILNDLRESQDKRKELDQLSLKAKKDIMKRRDDLKALEEKIKSKKLGSDSPEVDKFRNEARELQRYVRDTEEDFKRRYLKINKALTDKVISAISSYAKNNHIDLVLDKSQAVRGPVLFGDPGTDITESVIKSMNG